MHADDVQEMPQSLPPCLTQPQGVVEAYSHAIAATSQDEGGVCDGDPSESLVSASAVLARNVQNIEQLVHPCPDSGSVTGSLLILPAECKARAEVRALAISLYNTSREAHAQFSASLKHASGLGLLCTDYDALQTAAVFMSAVRKYEEKQDRSD